MIEEIWVRDVVAITWEILRWHRMKICLIEAAMPAALVFVQAAPIHKRLAHIGETEEEVRKSIKAGLLPDPRPPMATVSPELLAKKRSANRKLLRKFSVATPATIEPLLEELRALMAEYKLIDDTAMTRAVLEEFDWIERIDRQISLLESRRIGIYREIDRRRASFAYALRERIRNIEEAEFKVIKPEKHHAKKKRQKNAA